MASLCLFLGGGMVSNWGAEPLPISEKPIQERIGHRTYPSVFQAWNPADNLTGEAPLVTVARHDLVFNGPGFFGLRWDQKFEGIATAFVPSSIQDGLARRRTLLKLNPNLVLIMEIRYRDGPRDFLPENHPWWKRDRAGKNVMGWEEGGYRQLDFSNPAYRDQVARQCAAAVESGVVDGIMLDWWKDDDDRFALITAIRQRIGDQPLILVNANDHTTPRTAPFVNGYYMECYRSETTEDWRRIADTLTWAEKNLCRPRINCVETWFHHSRDDLDLMRATTALTLTLSDGYCLFADPNPLPTPDHLHNWYAFWNKSLGPPLSPGTHRPDGSFSREFTHGTVVYNPMGNAPVTVTFSAPKISAATGQSARTHLVNGGDGDLFLRTNEP